MQRPTRLLPALVLTVMILAVASPGAGSARLVDDGRLTAGMTHENGLLLYQRFGEAGPEPGVFVAGPDGTELRRIETPVLERLVATRLGHRALGRTKDGEVYLIDAEAGTARQLDLPESARESLALEPTHFAGGGTRWWLLGDPRLSLGYLVDLETGTVSDLTEIDGSIEIIFAGTFSSDDEHLLLATGDQVWLVPTENPRRARRLGGLARSYSGSFSPDGASIVYTRQTSNRHEVILERIADLGLRSDVVATSEAPIRAIFSPDGSQLLLTRPGTVSLLLLADRQERELLTFTGRGLLIRFSDDGSRILVGYNAAPDDTPTWWLAHRDGSAATELDDLHGYVPYSGSYFPGYAVDQALHWLFFAGYYPPIHGIAGAPVLRLDLTTGAVRRVFRMKDDIVYFSLGAGVADGRVGLLLAQDVDTTQLWLLDAERAESHLLAEARFVGGTFSPDGRWVAVSTFSDENGTRTAHLTLVATDGSATVPVGEGYGAVWLQP